MPLSIPIIDDTTLEGTESFFVQLSIAPISTSLAMAGTPNLAPVIINSNRGEWNDDGRLAYHCRLSADCVDYIFRSCGWF